MVLSAKNFKKIAYYSISLCRLMWKRPTCSKRFGGRAVWGGWQVLKGCEVRLLRSVGAIMTSFGLWIGVFPSSDNIGLDWLILAIWFRGVPGLIRQDVNFCLWHLFQKNLQGQVLGVRHVQWRSEKLRFFECEWFKVQFRTPFSSSNYLIAIPNLTLVL